jgi:hypothetical protein
MVIAVAVGDVGAATIIQFYLEAVTHVARVIDRIKVVNRSVSDAGGGAAAGKQEQSEAAAYSYPKAEIACVQKFGFFHFNQRVWFLVRKRAVTLSRLALRFCELLSSLDATQKKLQDCQ